MGADRSIKLERGVLNGFVIRHSIFVGEYPSRPHTFVSIEVDENDLRELRNQIDEMLEPVVEVPAEVLTEWQKKDDIRNPMALNEDALAEIFNDNQADGFKNHAFYMGDDFPTA